MKLLTPIDEYTLVSSDHERVADKGYAVAFRLDEATMKAERFMHFGNDLSTAIKAYNQWRGAYFSQL